MTLWRGLGILCMGIGFALAAFDGHFWFDTTTWFIAAIAFFLVNVPLPWDKKTA